MSNMFNAKRVGRDELQSPGSSPPASPDPDVEELLRARLNDAYAFTTTHVDVDIDTPTVDDDGNAAAHGGQEEETELRLFAAPANAAPQTYKIRLSSPGAGNAEPGFVVKKPRSYYFSQDPTSDEEDALQAAAIDGQTVLELSKEAWPGCVLPWKVRVLPLAGTRKAMLLARASTLDVHRDETHKRARKGKKTRIAIRKKLQAAREKKEAQAKLVHEKEEAEREKRARRNREKKLKKRAKGQAKKGAGEGAEDGVEDTAGPVATEQEADVQD